MALGLNNSDLFENSLEDFEIASHKDDVILFYSDGLTETMDTARNEFGVDKVKQLLIDNSNKSAEEIKNEILKNIYKNYSNHPIRQLTADSFSKKIFEGEIPIFYKLFSEILEQKGGEEN